MTLVDPSPGAGGASGVEYPTLVFCGTNYAYNFWPAKGLLREAEIVTVHEFGHQFWYGLVGSNEFEEAWLDEGFTTYSTAKVMELGYGRDASFIDFLGLELGAVEADDTPWHGRPASAVLRVPPLGAVWLVPEE